MDIRGSGLRRRGSRGRDIRRITTNCLLRGKELELVEA